MDTAALVIAGLAAMIAGLGTIMANRRANEALRESRKAVTTTLWSAVQEAVQRLFGFDPTTEPIGERLANLRITIIDLADEYADWDGLDTWLEAERVLGATLRRQVMVTAKPRDSVEQRLGNLDPLMSWAHALSQNLRRFRATGYDERALSKLQAHAQDFTKSIHERHGWQMEPSSSSHFSPLD